MKIYNFIFSSLALFCFTISANAQQPVYSSGRAEVSYEGWSVSRDVKEAAIKKAKDNALRAYMSERSESDAKRFDSLESSFLSDIDAYIISSSMLGEATYSDRKKYSVVLQVQLNLNRINQKLIPKFQTKENEKPELPFLFISRQLIEQQKFDDRVLKRNEIAQANTGGKSVSETVKGSSANRGVNTTSSASANLGFTTNINQLTTTETDGSVTTKAARLTYKLSSSSSFNSTFLERLTAQDWSYDPVELETEPKINLDFVKNDFASHEEIQPINLLRLFDEVRQSGFKYVALGTLNISLPKMDSDLGLYRVSVEVNARIYDIGGRRVRTILTVQPTLVNGFDRDELKAQSKAIREAAAKSSKDFLSQLANKPAPVQ